MSQSWRWIPLLVVCAALSVAAEAFAGTVQTNRAPFRADIRALGMGGAYVAAGKNGNAFLYNPALLTQVGTDVSLPISIGIDQNTIDVFDFVSDNQDKLENFDELTTEEQAELYRDMTRIDDEDVRVRISPLFNIVTKNFGLAAYGTVNAGAAISKGIYEPRVRADGLGDVVVVLGLANQVSPRLAVGVNAKIVNRRSAGFRVGASKVGDTFDSILDSLEQSDTGFALDVGGLIRLSNRARVGVVAQDLIGKVGDEEFPLNLKAGIAWDPVRRITLTADVTDLFNQDGVSLFNRVFMGGEVRVPVLQLRGGFYQGYPSFGAGINLFIVKLDYAFYRQEFGRLPGVDGRSQHEFQFKIGWGW